MPEQIGVTYRPIHVGGARTPGHHLALFYNIFSADGPPSFDDRFGNWFLPPNVDGPAASNQQMPLPQSGSSTQTDPRDIRVLGRFTRAPDGSLVPAPLGLPNRP